MRPKTRNLRPAVGNPLAAVPMMPDGVEMRADSAGNLQLRVTPTLGPVRARVARWLGQDHSSKVALDEHGTFYVRQIDGTRSLQAIVDAMVENTGRPRKDVEDGIVLFTRKLMTKNMLALKVPATSEGAE